MTAPDVTGTLEGTVEIEYGQWYLYDLAARDDGLYQRWRDDQPPPAS